MTRIGAAERRRSGAAIGREESDRAKEGKHSPKQETIVVYKADIQSAAAVKDWLAGLADHVGAPVTVTLDMALKAFAEARGFRPMPRRRVR
jgi:hypothetical protein